MCHIFNYLPYILPSCLPLAIPAWTRALNPSKVTLSVPFGSAICLTAAFSSSVGGFIPGILKDLAIASEATLNSSWVTKPAPLVSILAQASLRAASNLTGSFAISLYFSFFIIKINKLYKLIS